MSTANASPETPAKPPVVRSEEANRDLIAIARRWCDRYAALAGFAVMVAIFWILKPDTFGTWENFKAILNQAAPTVILAVGLTVVLTTDAYDLSFPGAIAMASIVGVLLMRDDSAGTFVAVAATIAVGAAIGLISGG